MLLQTCCDRISKVLNKLRAHLSAHDLIEDERICKIANGRCDDDAMMRENDLRLRDFVGRIRPFVVKPECYSDPGTSERLFFNINTPDDYAAAIEMEDLLNA